MPVNNFHCIIKCFSLCFMISTLLPLGFTALWMETGTDYRGICCCKDCAFSCVVFFFFALHNGLHSCTHPSLPPSLPSLHQNPRDKDTQWVDVHTDTVHVSYLWGRREESEVVVNLKTGRSLSGSFCCSFCSCRSTEVNIRAGQWTKKPLITHFLNDTKE